MKNELNKLKTSFPEIETRALRAYLEQYWFGQNFLLPYLNKNTVTGKKVLEIGTAEGGLLRYFSKMGMNCYGLELNPERYKHSQILMPDSDIRFMMGDITDNDQLTRLGLPGFDFIILRDVLEHIKHKHKTMSIIYDLLNKNGKVFISYPAKHSAFAGHQQTSGSMFVKIPYIYILPDMIYKSYMELFNVKKQKIDYLLKTKYLSVDTKKLINNCKNIGFKIEKYDKYIIRPEWKFRFGVPTLKYGFNTISNPAFFVNGVNLVLSKSR